MFGNIFGAPKTGGNGAGSENVSLLAEWNSYQAAPDIERPPNATVVANSSVLSSVSASSASSFFQSTVERAGTSMNSMFQATAKSVSAIPASLPTAETFSIPTSQQLMYMMCFLAAGALFLFLAFFLFLPTIILSPSKFALSFTIGCCCIMAGMSSLRGWKQQLSHMTTPERLPFSAAYVGSIVATLYAALFMHSYILSIICSALQVVALLYYVMSYFPGGAQGVKFLLSMLTSAATSCFGSLMKR